MRPGTRRSKTARRIAAGWLAAAVAVGCAAAKSASPDPVAVVNAVYQDHFAHEQRWDLTYERQAALFTPELRALLEADARAAAANSDEIVGLDFDPLTDAQEEMTSFQVAPLAIEGDSASVGVVLLLDSARTDVRVRLARSGGEWRIANLHYAHGDLVSLLLRLAADRRRGR